jgi:hypothetical protein
VDENIRARIKSMLSRVRDTAGCTPCWRRARSITPQAMRQQLLEWASGWASAEPSSGRAAACWSREDCDGPSGVGIECPATCDVVASVRLQSDRCAHPAAGTKRCFRFSDNARKSTVALISPQGKPVSPFPSPGLRWGACGGAQGVTRASSHTPSCAHATSSSLTAITTLKPGSMLQADRQRGSKGSTGI